MQQSSLHELGTENSGFRHFIWQYSLCLMLINIIFAVCWGLQACLSSSPHLWHDGRTVIIPAETKLTTFIGFTLNSINVLRLSIKLCYKEQSAGDLEKSVEEKNLCLGLNSRNLWAWDAVEGKYTCKYWVEIKMCGSLSEKWWFYPVILHVQSVYLLNQNFREKR